MRSVPDSTAEPFAENRSEAGDGVGIPEPFAGIQRWSGELSDPALEAEYREATREGSLRRLRLLGYPAALFYLLGVGVDVSIAGFDPLLTGGLLLARAAVAVTIVAVVALCERRQLAGNRLDSAVAIPMVLVSVVTCGIVATVGGGLSLHALTVLILVLIYYLLLPVRQSVVLGISLVQSAGFVFVALLRLDPKTAELHSVILYLALVNLLGYLASRERHLSSRREYLGLLAERRATEALRAEITARSAAEERLAESEMRFRSLVELSPDAILVHRKGRILYLNPRGVELVGAATSEDVVGRSAQDFVLPESVDVVRERLLALEQGAKSLPAAEVMVRTLNGEEVACEVVAGTILFEGEPAVQSVIRVIEQRRRLMAELTRLATTDSLTGICNRRRFFEQLEQEWSRARRHRRPLSIVIFDLDHFKRVNDEHGHAVGDAVLQALVEAVKEILRSEDLLARLGGEEFCILVPEIDLEGARALAERLRKRVSEVEVEATEGPVRTTVSVGVAEVRLTRETPEMALKRADDALYRAKRAGRNRVETG